MISSKWTTGVLVVQLWLAIGCGETRHESAQSTSETADLSTVGNPTDEGNQKDFIFSVGRIPAAADLPEMENMRVILQNNETGEESAVSDYHILQLEKNGNKAYTLYGNIKLPLKNAYHSYEVRVAGQRSNKVYLNAPVSLSPSTSEPVELPRLLKIVFPVRACLIILPRAHTAPQGYLILIQLTKQFFQVSFANCRRYPFIFHACLLACLAFLRGSCRAPLQSKNLPEHLPFGWNFYRH
jgi:hypothetical protein